MGATKQQNAIRRIRDETIENMKNLGIYRDEFLPSIRNYAKQRYLLDQLQDKLLDGEFSITEEYTNNNGSTNVRKTAEYLALETLRRDVLAYETTLGLNPSGLRRVRTKIDTKKKSKLEMALSELQGT